MCITEYNEKTFVDGIRAEGREEGQNLLATVVQRLRKGRDSGTDPSQWR